MVAGIEDEDPIDFKMVALESLLRLFIEFDELASFFD